MKWKQTEFIHRFHARTAWDQELFYSNMYPPNMTVDWLDTDTPKNAKSDSNIHYSFNEYGFRSESFNNRQDINILTNGCSLTVGIGVKQENTWPYVLKELISNHLNKSVSVWNIALSGSSPDYVVRSTYKIIKPLEPHWAFIYWPPISRFEGPDPGYPYKLWQSLLGDDTFHKDFVNDEYLQAQFKKNIIFIDRLIDRRLFMNDIETSVRDNKIEIDKLARDGQHPGESWHRQVAYMFFGKFKERNDK